MDAAELLLLSMGLAMDCLAVSVSSGAAFGRFKVKEALVLGAAFGFFQAGMPLLGYFGGRSLASFVSGYGRIIAFALLLFIGGKMIHESFKEEGGGLKLKKLSIATVLILAVATSIDALAVGVSFAFLGMGIFFPILMIGIASFLAAFWGFYIGARTKHLLGSKVGILGGIILVLIAVRTLLAANLF